MLISAKTMSGFRLDSLNGEIGEVQEFYFDDRHWTVRYLVADTGNWLLGRRVLISPYSLGAVSKADRCIAIDLTRKQIEQSPTLYTDKPVSRQFEEEYHGFFGWPAYWSGPEIWGSRPFIERDRRKWNESQENEKGWDPHLRSTRDVSGHGIQATDGEIGHVEDFILDDQTWSIRYLVIATQNWLPGKKVLVSPRWIDRVSWSESKVFLHLSRESIKFSPEYTEDLLVTRDYEISLHHHHNREGYWVDRPKTGAQSR